MTPDRPTQTAMLTTRDELQRVSADMKLRREVRGKPDVPHEAIRQCEIAMENAIEIIEAAEYWLRPEGQETQP